MTEEREKALLDELKVWFEDNKRNNDAFKTNVVGEWLKNKLRYLNRWKELPRGNARKGLLAMLAKVNSNQDRDYDYRENGD